MQVCLLLRAIKESLSSVSPLFERQTFVCLSFSFAVDSKNLQKLIQIVLKLDAVCAVKRV